MMRMKTKRNGSLWASFLKDESGATAIEYALIGALIAIAIIGGMSALATGINGVFGDATTELSTSVE